MKTKSWVKYFFIITMILFVVFFVDNIFYDIIENFNMMNKLILESILFISIGLLLGVDQILLEIKKNGKWRVNIAKLVLLGIPALYFSFSILIYFGLGRYLPDVLTYPIPILLGNNTGNSPDIISLFQLILGFTIISSFYKDGDERK